MVVVLWRAGIITTLAAMCWAILIGVFLVFGALTGAIVVALWLAAGLIALS